MGKSLVFWSCLSQIVVYQRKWGGVEVSWKERKDDRYVVTSALVEAPPATGGLAQ